jgi:HK97 family phage portal protein
VRLGDLLPWRRKNATLELWREIYGGRTSKTGQTVGLREALRCATVLACTRVIATGIAQVPLKLYREDAATRRKEPARDHPLFRVLHRRPNPWQTSFEFRETLGLHLALAGKAYCYKVVVRGQIRELIPFEPHMVKARLLTDGITVVYDIAGRDGTSMTGVPADMIWHLKGPSWSGWEALDALDLAREAVGLSLATEASQANLHRSGVRSTGTYSLDGTLNVEQHKAMRKFLQDNYAGDNSGAPMILDRGAKWLQTAMTGVDAQHLETRKHQIAEVCRAMGVLPIMVYESDKAATYASAEAMFQAHVVHTMTPWWERIEQSIDCNLLTERDAEAGVYAKFQGNALLRGTMKDRADYYSKALGAGGSPAWMTQDEVRSLEELNPMGEAASRLPVVTNAPRAPAPAPTPDSEPAT